MKYDGGKRAFLVALLVIFALLVYLCIDGREIIRWTAEVAYTRQNESLYIETLEDGSIYIVIHSGSRHLGLEVAKY